MTERKVVTCVVYVYMSIYVHARKIYTMSRHVGVVKRLCTVLRIVKLCISLVGEMKVALGQYGALKKT